MNKKAFTLIELLVVISIIAQLLAILMPALAIVKKKAQGVVCTSNVSQLSKAWYAYAADNDDNIVGGSTTYYSDDQRPDGSPNAAWSINAANRSNSITPFNHKSDLDHNHSTLYNTSNQL